MAIVGGHGWDAPAESAGILKGLHNSGVRGNWQEREWLEWKLRP